MSTRAVFLDKDGTLIEDVPYNVDPALMRLLPGAAEGLRRLHLLGYHLVIVSNQSGVARGYFPESALLAVEFRLGELLAGAGVPLAGFHYCPHHPEGVVRGYAISCTCRKPAPGLIHRAARRHGIDLSQSWLIGDQLDDVEAGRRAGCTTVRLGDARPVSHDPLPERRPHHVAADLSEAAGLIAAGRTGVSDPLKPTEKS